MEKRPDETNWEFCERWARSIDKDTLIRKLMEELQKREKRKRFPDPLWAIIGEATSHGCGVSQAIMELYMGKNSPAKGK